MSKKIFFPLIVLYLLTGPAHAAVSDGWEKHVIAQQHRPIYLIVHDMDHDGDPDIVSTTNQHPGLFYSEVAWFRNNLNEDGQWEQHIVSSSDLEDDPVAK